MIKSLALPALGAALILSTSTGQAAAANAAWVGAWQIDEKESHYPASFPPIKNHIFTVEKDDGTVLKYTDRMEINGKPFSSSFDGAWGKASKTSDGHTITYKRVGDNGYEDSWTDDAGTKGEDHCVFTTPAVMDCKGSTTPKGGQTLSYTEHWNKIQ